MFFQERGRETKGLLTATELHSMTSPSIPLSHTSGLSDHNMHIPEQPLLEEIVEGLCTAGTNQ